MFLKSVKNFRLRWWTRKGHLLSPLSALLLNTEQEVLDVQYDKKNIKTSNFRKAETKL